MGRHILDRTDAHCRQGERHAHFLGGLGGQNLAIRVLHPGQPDWGQPHRHRDLLTDHGAFGAAPAHIDGHLLTKAQLLEIRRVFAESLLRVRPAFGIVVKHLRDAALVHPLEVFDAGDHGHLSAPCRFGNISLPILRISRNASFCPTAQSSLARRGKARPCGGTDRNQHPRWSAKRAPVPPP